MISASQTLSELALQAQTYVNAGVEEVWLVDHQTGSVAVWTPPGTTMRDDTATLTSPLPGFSVSVRFLLDG